MLIARTQEGIVSNIGSHIQDNRVLMFLLIVTQNPMKALDHLRFIVASINKDVVVSKGIVLLRMHRYIKEGCILDTSDKVGACVRIGPRLFIDMLLYMSTGDGIGKFFVDCCSAVKESGRCELDRRQLLQSIIVQDALLTRRQFVVSHDDDE